MDRHPCRLCEHMTAHDTCDLDESPVNSDDNTNCPSFSPKLKDYTNNRCKHYLDIDMGHGMSICSLSLTGLHCDYGAFGSPRCDRFEPMPPKEVIRDFEPTPPKMVETFDPVQRPSHYAEGRKYEPKDVIRDWDLNFNLGNAVKYVARAGRKGDILEDLKKARQYLDFEIDYLEER